MGKFSNCKLHGSGLRILRYDFTDRNEHFFCMAMGTFKNDYLQEGLLIESDGTQYFGTFKDGADKVVFPEQEMGRRVAKTLATKNFTDWISLSTDFSMVEAPLPEAWVGKCLLELNVREKFGINVVGIIRNQQVTVNIQPQECLEAGDMMILIGENKVLNDISKGNLV